MSIHLSVYMYNYVYIYIYMYIHVCIHKRNSKHCPKAPDDVLLLV